MTTLSALVAVARRQHRVFTVDQARELGFSKEALRHLVRTERIRREHYGVYSLNEPLSTAGIAMAAVLRCQPRSAMDRLTAAAALELRERWPATPQIVTARPGARTRIRGIDVRRSSTLKRSEIISVRKIPCTSVLRTIADCAPLLDDKALKQLVREAERRHRIDIHDLVRPGTPASLRRVLAKYVAKSGFTANEMEAAFYEICARAGLPPPNQQERIGPFRVDFIWPHLRLIVETDGRSGHDFTTAYADDRTRDRRLVALGYVLIRFTWAEIEFDPGLVASELTAVIVQRNNRHPGELTS